MDDMEMLVARGADLNVTDKEGRTLLMQASEKGNLEMVRYLVGKGAKVKARTKYGKTALIFACGRRLSGCRGLSGGSGSGYQGQE